jgi:hypothetical protein
MNCHSSPARRVSLSRKSPGTKTRQQGTQGIFTLNYHGKSTLEKEIQVFDPVGNLIYHTWLTGTSSIIDLSLFPKGPCFLSLTDQTHIYHQIILIQ